MFWRQGLPRLRLATVTAFCELTQMFNLGHSEKHLKDMDRPLYGHFGAGLAASLKAQLM